MIEWRTIPSAPGYEASSIGEIRRNNRIRKQALKKSGYLQLNLSLGGKIISRLVHTLVCEAFNGPCPEGKECAHDNGIKTDNRPSNLIWKTELENKRDKIRHGTSLRGSKNPNAILTPDQVREIRRRGASRKGYAEIAEDFGVSYAAVSLIVNGRNWQWL